MRFLRPVLCLLLIPMTASPAAEPDKAKVKKAAEKVAKATIENDAETIVKYTYPGLVEVAGGREKMVELTQATLKMTKDEGAAIKKFEVEEPESFHVEGKNTFALLTTWMEMTYQGDTIEGKSFLLAISPDEGKSWTFISANIFKDKKLKKKVLPKLPKKLEIPPQPEFKILKAEE